MMYVGVDVLVADVPMMQAGVDLVFRSVLWGSPDEGRLALVSWAVWLFSEQEPGGVTSVGDCLLFLSRIGRAKSNVLLL